MASKYDALFEEESPALGIKPSKYDALFDEGPQQQSQGPSFASMLPFGATGERLSQGKGFGYGEGSEGASRLAGDIGTGAGAIGAGMAAGASGVGLAPLLGGAALGIGAGAGANYLMEKTGAAPALRQGASNLRGLLPEPTTQNVPLNFALNALKEATPLGTLATGLESLPMLASSYVGAKAAPLGARMGSNVVENAKAGSVPSQASLDLAKYGGEPTPAAMSGGRFAKTAEFSSRSNPLMQLTGKFKGIDEANIQAARKFAEGKFGSDIKQGTRPAIGETMRGLLDELAGRRAAKYEPAVKALETAKGFPNYSKSLISQIEKSARDLNVTESAKKAFINAARDSLKGKNTPLAVDKALTDIRIKFGEKFPGSSQQVVQQLDRDFSSMMGELKKANYEALNRVKPGLGDEIAQAKGEYAGASKVISPMAKIMKSRSQKPEAIMGDILNQGTEGVKALMSELSPTEKKAFQREFARFVLEESKGTGGPSGASIKTMLSKRFKDIAPVIGGKELTDLGRLADMMEAAKSGDLYSQNPSGSAVTGAGLLQGGLAVPFLKPMLAKTALIDAPYAYAGAPIQKALMAGKGAVAKLGGAGRTVPFQGPMNLNDPLLRSIMALNAASAQRGGK